MAKRERRRFGALDAFVILLLIVSLVGVLARYMLTDENGILAAEPETVDVAVALLIQDLPYTSSGTFVEGTLFTISGNGGGDGVAEGVAISDFTETPAEYYAENENGEIELLYASGEYANIDCRGLLRVTGYYKNGVFMIGDGEDSVPLTAGMYITVWSGDLTETALVTDISAVT